MFRKINGLTRDKQSNMKTLKFLTLFISTVIICSCKDDDDMNVTEGDFLIFGHFYGLCAGEECVETFKLENEQLYEDRNDEYPFADSYHFSKLENEKYEGVKDIMNLLPSQLINEQDSTFGCPDCADQGGILIQYSKDGHLQNWTVDNDRDNVPAYLHTFMDSVNAKIAFIND